MVKGTRINVEECENLELVFSHLPLSEKVRKEYDLSKGQSVRFYRILYGNGIKENKGEFIFSESDEANCKLTNKRCNRLNYYGTDIEGGGRLGEFGLCPSYKLQLREYELKNVRGDVLTNLSVATEVWMKKW